jgi:AcrR family transcriptional regulator
MHKRNSNKPNSNKAEQARSRGRPSDQDGEDLREQLLDAAETRFADHGYAATSLRSVAEAVGVNAALLHYYFGSKHDLMLAVLHRLLEPLAAAVAELRRQSEVNTHEMTALVFRTIGEHPTLPRLLVREVLLGDGTFTSYFMEHFAPRLGAVLAQVIHSEQQHGHLDPEFDANTVMLMILSLSLFPFVARPVAEPMLGIGYDAEGRERLLHQVNRMLEKGLLP